MVNIIKQIIIIILITIASILFGALGWHFQFILISVVFLCVGYFVDKISLKNKLTFFLGASLPFTLIYGFVIFTANKINIKILPILFAPMIFYVFGVLIKKRSKIILLSIIVIQSFLGFLFMVNWINYHGYSKGFTVKEFPKTLIIDNNNLNVNFDSKTIKIIDVWSSSCGICIKKFPDFEQLKEKYKEDNEVTFYALNLPLKRDSIIDVKKYTSKYSFKSLYAKDLDAWNQLQIKGVPQFLILNKSNKIVYQGSLNSKWYDFYNNFDVLIKTLKNE